MSTPLIPDGLTARRKTIEPTSKLHHVSLGIFALAALLFSCKPGTEEKTDNQKETAVAADSLHQPKVDIKVNRHYDDKGNIIGFDSTYSSYYSNVMGDTSRMDSLMGSFDTFFRRDHSSFLSRQFDPLFFNDSLRYPDFFHDDFFMKRYELNDAYMRRMMGQMDSIKNGFYKMQSDKTKRRHDSVGKL